MNVHGVWVMRIAALASAACWQASCLGATLRFMAEEGEKIGSRAVGLVCFPKQPLRWSREYRPDPEDVQEVFRRRLGDRAVQARAEIKQLKLSICQPYWGPVGTRIGSAQQLKGQIEMQVAWTVVDDAGCASAPLESHVQFKIPSEMRGGISAALLMAVDASAADFATTITKRANCTMPDRATSNPSPR